jgi:TolB protein
MRSNPRPLPRARPCQTLGPSALALFLLTAVACGRPVTVASPSAVALPDMAAPGATATRVEPLDGEQHFGRIWRLTDGGQNAEAYFSADGQRIIFQGRQAGQVECDQIYVMDLNGANRRMVSTGEGRTTCGFFFPTGDRILFSSTHHVDRTCPPPPDRSRGYVWPILPYDIFTARPDGSDLRRLTNNDGYDAEATISPDGRNIVFTSARDGDIDIYVMNADGSNVRRLTHEPGYDGGPFFSPDGTKIVYRGHHPTDSAGIADFRALLAAGLVRPNRVEIMVMNADGSGKRQLTNNGAANFAPFFHPDGRRIIFSSNMDDPSGRSFSLYMIDSETGSLQRVTRGATFDGFPMFSPDGRLLMFASTRNATAPGDFNIFVAEWRD